jgi:hypothetical protein
MKQQEVDDLAIDILNHLSIVERGSAEDAANSATEMCKAILKRYPRIRYSVWQWNKQDVLDELGLDYGKP